VPGRDEIFIPSLVENKVKSDAIKGDRGRNKAVNDVTKHSNSASRDVHGPEETIHSGE